MIVAPPVSETTKTSTAALADWFIEARARIGRENAAAPKGRATCHALADLTDGVIRQLFRRALPSRGRERVRQQLAVVAAGGYGRRELCSYSDIDVTFVVGEVEEPVVDAAWWLARVAFEGGEWDPWRRLGRAGALSREEAAAAAAAREFYLTLRNWMHFDTGRPADLLTRDRQEALAAALGYQDDPPVAA